MADIDEICEFCIYSMAWDVRDHIEYECRRFPPGLKYEVQHVSHLSHGWPLVRRDDWCGEFKRKPPSPYPGMRKSESEEASNG